MAATGSATEASAAAMDEDERARLATEHDLKSKKIHSLLFGFKCRFYRKAAPAEEELCMVKVRRVAEMGAYVDLQEYEDREGMVLLSELSRRRIRSIKKLIGEGKMEVCMVIGVNDDAGYIDLSKRRVDAEDRLAYEKRYNHAVVVQNTMRKVVKDTFNPDEHEDGHNPLASLCERLSWRLYDDYPHAIDGLNAMGRDPTLMDKYDLTDAEKASLREQLARKNQSVAVKVRADIQVTCFGYEGVVAIRQALAAARDTGTKESPLSVRNVAPPVYCITGTFVDAEEGKEALDAAIRAATAKIAEFGGDLAVVSAPSTAMEDEL